jgi:hypothetical protein
VATGECVCIPDRLCEVNGHRPKVMDVVEVFML